MINVELFLKVYDIYPAFDKSDVFAPQDKVGNQN